MPRKLNNWLSGYRDYTAQLESPDAFHIWTALSVISASLKRQVFVDQAYFMVYPNLYVLLVAPPGTCRKSQAMNTGLKLLRAVPAIHIEANKMTPEALINSLCSGGQTQAIKTKAKKTNATTITVRQVCTSVLFSPEFSVMLGKDAENNGMLSILTDLFDSPDSWIYETRGRGQEIVSNVYLSIFGATTPAWLSNSIPDNAIGLGLNSRFIHVAQKARRHANPRPKITPALLRLRDSLIEDLIQISMLRGEMVLTSAADTFYDEWYRALNTKNLDEKFWGYLERKPVHILKVATILSIAESDRLVLTRDHLEMALVLLNQIELRMPEAFISAGSTSGKDIQRVLQQIILSGGQIEYGDLVQANIRYLTSPQIEIIIRTMREGNIIEEIIIPKTSTRIIKFKPKPKPPEEVE